MRDSHRIREGFDLHLDNRQIAAFVIGSLVVLGVVFSMGVLVGKQLAGATPGPAGPGDPLAAIDAKEKARAGDPVPAEPAAKPDALTFQAELTKPAANTVVEPTKPAAEKKDPKEAKEPAKDPAKDEKVADNTDKKPDEKKKPEEKPEKVADKPEKKETGEKKLAAAFDKVAKGDGSGAGQYTLQVASLPTQEEADKLVAKLTAKGLTAYIFEADVPNKGHMFRVRSGAFATRGDAEEGLKFFKKRSALPAIISTR